MKNATCGECGKEIGDFHDDCGYFYKIVSFPLPEANYGEPLIYSNQDSPQGGYVAVCQTCCGPLTGDR